MLVKVFLLNLGLLMSNCQVYQQFQHGDSGRNDHRGYHSHSQYSQPQRNGPPILNIGGGSTLPPLTNDGQFPWRNHVDFNEQHPGEDQLAVESSRSVSQYPSQPNVYAQRSQPAPNRNDPYYNPFTHLNNFYPQSAGDGVYPVWSIFGQRSWWKGPNVCIKREEEDEKLDHQTISNSNQRGGWNVSSSLSGHPALHMSLSTCDNLDTKYLCTTRVLGQGLRKVLKTIYECCDGYSINQRLQECKRGQFENIAKTMEALGAREFLELVKSTNLLQKIETEELTIFVPTDEAVKAYRSPNRQQQRSQISNSDNSEVIRRRRNVLLHTNVNRNERDNSSGRRKRNTKNQETHQSDGRQEKRADAIIEMNFDDDVDWRRNTLDDQATYLRQPDHVPETGNYGSSTDRDQLLSHMLQGKINTDDFVDEKLIFNQMNQGERGVIRMNTWEVGGEKINTVNCARMISVNHRCTNGNIHLINRMMTPVTKSIADIISSDPDFSLLTSLLHASGLLEKFRDVTQHLTLLAPTNRAMTEHLDATLLAKMQRGDSCLQRILQNHIIPISFCSDVILKTGQVRNLNHGVLRVERTGDDEVFFNGSKIIKRDIVALNGVIQVLDEVLVAETDRPLTSALENNELTSFLQSLRQAGLSSELDDLSNVTVFAPFNEAFDTLPEEVKNHPQRMREILLYHIATPETRACHFVHEQQISTKLSSRSIQMNLYSNFPLGTEAEVTAQCGRLTKVNKPACSGIIHVIDRVLIPADLDMIEMLRTQTDFSIINRLIEKSGLIDTLRGTGPFTMFAPKDSAFYALPRQELDKILSDSVEATQLVKAHIISENLCCAGILPNMWFLTKRVSTLGGGHVSIARDSRGVMYGGSKITTCDLTATNGVIHSIDKIFKAEEQQSFNGNNLMGSCLPQKLETTDIMAFFVRG